MSKNTEARGGAPAKTGKWALALDRGAGYRDTMESCNSGTRSPFHPSNPKHYRYEKKGDLSSNDNLRGYGE